MPPSFLLFFFGLLSAAGSLLPPRTSFLLPSADRPLVLFRDPDVHNTTTLLLSDDGATLYVGARDAVLSLDVSRSDVISLKKKVEWRPSESEIKDCENKGKNAIVDCPNFVRVLQLMNSTHLYACGSYAYSPHDASIDAESLSLVQHADTKAKVRCPFSPVQKSTAIAVDGELFTATATSFRGVEPQISRHFSKDGRQDVSQDSSVSLLEEPTFISSASDPSGGKIYFFFSEVGREFSFVDELRIARVAQVCKDDVGGQRTLQNKWTSFAKASLLCQVPRRLPFNVLQDVFTLPPPGDGSAADTLFYGVFTSQWSLGPESAVCVFRLQDIRAVFAGSYRTFDFHNYQRSSVKHSHLGQCGLGNASDPELEQVKKNFLASVSVSPVGGGPVLVSPGQQYSHVAAMRTQAANGKQYTVLFLLTESGFLHKVVLLDRGAHVVEEVQVFSRAQLVKSIVLSASKGVLYVGTSEGVVAVPVARCSGYRTCSQCVLARDPLCGWSRTAGACTALVAGQHNLTQDLEDGNVGQQCRGQTRNSLLSATEVSVHLNEAVRLRCSKPSNMAVLSWTSSRPDGLPDHLFLRSADGGLSFLAAANTFGTYRCEAEEGGYREAVASYEVRQIAPPEIAPPEIAPPEIAPPEIAPPEIAPPQMAPPRSFSPNAEEHHVNDSEDEPYEDIFTTEPETSTTRPSGDPEDSRMKDKGVPGTTDWSDASPTEVFALTPRTDARSGGEAADERRRVPERSFYSELVVVSLLLAACVCALVLGGVHVWRQRRTGLRKTPLVGPGDGGKTNQSMESVPSLSSPEDAGPEVKVE